MIALQFLDLLALPSVRRSAWALAAAGVSMPIVGVFIIGLDVITVRFAVMHMALFGTALGLWVGVDPTVMALTCCLVTGLVLAPAADRPGGLAGPMSFLMTISAAGALLVLSISGLNANRAFAILWCSIVSEALARSVGPLVQALDAFLHGVNVHLAWVEAGGMRLESF